MSGLEFASVGCALVAALLFACGAVAQQSAASAIPEGSGLVGELVRTPRWWAGIVGDGGGYAMQVLALALGSVLLVQPILVSALVFALPLAARFSGRRITPRTWAMAAALTGALAAFLVIGNPTEGNGNAPLHDWVLPLACLVAVVAGSIAAGFANIEAGWRALSLGVASGLLYGLAAALTKYVTDLFDKGLVEVLTSWQTWVLVGAGVTGVFLQQKAFQVGPLAASLPAVTICEPLAAVFLGMTVLDERLRTDGAGIAVTVVAVLVMFAATLALSRSQAESEFTPTSTPTTSG